MESGVSETSGEVNDYRTESTSSRRRRPSTSQQLSSIEGPPVVLRDYSSMLPSLKVGIMYLHCVCAFLCCFHGII